MPKRLDVQKRRARALAGGDRGPADLIAHFFHFLNFGHTKGHAEPGGYVILLDRHSRPADQLLWEVSAELAEEMAFAAAAGGAGESIDYDAKVEKLRHKAAKIGEEDRIEEMLFHFLHYLMHYVFLDQDRHETSERICAFRCVARCGHEACGRWFFMFDDRQDYCSEQCRPSRRDERRPVGAKLHIVRRRRST
jgi:hypothetical protein